MNRLIFPYYIKVIRFLFLFCLLGARFISLLVKHGWLGIYFEFFCLLANFCFFLYIFLILESIKKNYAYTPYTGHAILCSNKILVINLLQLLVVGIFGLILIQHFLVIKRAFALYIQLLPVNQSFSFGCIGKELVF